MGFTRLAASKPTIAAISGWCLAGGLELALWCDLRIATETGPARVSGAPLGRAADRRRHPAAAEDRRSWAGAGADPHRPHRRSRGGPAMGLVNEVVAAGRHLDRALELAEGLAVFPQTTMLSDRRAALEGLGLPLDRALELEAELGRERRSRSGSAARPVRRRRGPRRRGLRAPKGGGPRSRCGTRSAAASRSRPRPRRPPRRAARAGCRGSSSPAGRRPGRCRPSCSS